MFLNYFIPRTGQVNFSVKLASGISEFSFLTEEQETTMSQSIASQNFYVKHNYITNLMTISSE